MADLQSVATGGWFLTDAATPDITDVGTVGWFSSGTGGGDSSPADTTTSTAIMMGIFSIVFGWGEPRPNG